MTTTLISDPAVALELGRRMAANAQRQPRLRKRWGSTWHRWFTDRIPAGKPARTRV